ncbi:MAG: alpha/beta fold hydrolase [Solirubrobacteraceae bacterium]
MRELEIQSGEVTLRGEEAGEGRPVVLLHGLTASRRYVVMGSRALERDEHRVVTYDARGHGKSDGAEEPSRYGYDALCADLEAVLDSCGIERATLAGASMGAHTLLRFALDHPERVEALVVITPAHEPERFDDPHRLARWDALSDGLREGGVEGFIRAYGVDDVPERWRATIAKVLEQRMSAHEHPEAVADALRTVPRSEPFSGLEDLAGITAPATVVASRDEADPGHPFALAEEYAAAIPGAQFVSEDPGSSPLAWQGGQLSKVIAATAARAAG